MDIIEEIMIMPSDQDYKDTKLIMQGRTSINEAFKPLANWIEKSYGVKPVNIVYDTIANDRPRLQICFEFAHENAKFNGQTLFSFDSDKQKAVRSAFKRTLIERGLIQNNTFLNLLKKPHYQTDDLFVYFSAFEPIALIEANEKIPISRIDQLKEEINDRSLWEISRAFSRVTFFLYSDEQVKQYENSAIRTEWTKKYFRILKEYDEFNYFKEDVFNIAMDSKETFDNKYSSNWYYYYK